MKKFKPVKPVISLKRVQVRGSCKKCKRPLRHKQPVFKREGETIQGDLCPDCAFDLMAAK
jgi:hypothetical protein